MSFKAEQVPLEVDVWNVIEDELRTGIIDALDLDFYYSGAKREGRVRIRHPKDSRIVRTELVLTMTEAEDLIHKLAFTFNFQMHNLVELSFDLRPGELPTFGVEIQPYVKDVSELDNKKSRREPITIN